VLDRHDQVMRNLEAHGLDRDRERLPGAEEIERRRAAGRGLTRPEIAVILAHAKNLIHELLLEGDIPDDPGMADVLVRYFPEPLRDGYAAHIATHRLARQIIATELANEIIDRVGPGFVYRIEDRTGADTDQAIRAILVVKQLLGLDELWDGLAPYSVAQTIPVRQALERVLEYNASWLVRRKSALGPVDEEAAVFAGAVARLHESLAARQELDAGSPLAGALGQLEALGAPRDLLIRCRAAAGMHAALALAAAAAQSGFDIVELEQTYAMIGDTLSLSWLYATIPITSGDPHWVQLAKAALRDELAALTVAIAADVLATGGLATWTARHEDALARARSAYAGLAGSSGAGSEEGSDVDVAMLTVGVQVLRDLCHAVGA
jgi:glutamate dehydrogenase